MLTELLVDAKSFVIELILVFLCNSCKLISIIAIKSVDIVHDF